MPMPTHRPALALEPRHSRFFLKAPFARNLGPKVIKTHYVFENFPSYGTPPAYIRYRGRNGNKEGLPQGLIHSYWGVFKFSMREEWKTIGETQDNKESMKVWSNSPGNNVAIIDLTFLSVYLKTVVTPLDGNAIWLDKWIHSATSVWLWCHKDTTLTCISECIVIHYH
jgi:hypothetical protein